MKPTALILSFYLFGLMVATKCYFPNGDEAPERYRPCGTHRTIFNTCCDRGNLNLGCLKNGLCAKSPDIIKRGACTDKDWSGCQEVCSMREEDRDPLFSLLEPTFALKEFPAPKNMPVGAITAGAIGGAFVVAIVSGLAWRSFQRRRRATGVMNRMIGTPARGEKDSKANKIIRPLQAEVDGGPNSVLVESDARPVQPGTMHELPA
ncbi:uncharacterized protein FTJAE_12039 [Fusarium tjaetaba]|uniref:Uncharacterized protein n=1 Tax=Fusarium tjaetaba TaxID=1567544 RepID=A0A8H5VD52_9HYPO|nr:uncharacterized protein FTJAE_12039 [Fusarium tjaetaba]KAF5619156.1 hypothetical protein FTJAE_12039 [Fusarium tjaetaba]